MKNFDTRTYNISDFIEWSDNGLLELSPDFQRRSVWTEKAKSYLVDTILRCKPIPKILITQNLQGAKNVRVVVDGQQRLRTILGFYNGDFKISRVHNKDFGGRTFDELPEEVQNEFLKYELGVDILFDLPYEDILDIFARINSYTVKLKPQEILNARYVGYFKQIVFGYGLKYVKYYIDGSVLTRANVTRMAEAELTADLFVALIDTVRTNKGIENYYKKYEEEEDSLPEAAQMFDKTMSYIGSIYPPLELANTNWKRPQLFYTLFTSIAHCLYGLNGLNKDSRIKINEKSIGKLRVILDEISLKFDEYTEDKDAEIPTGYKDFINYSRRGTTDTAARTSRANFLCKKIQNSLSE
ncbi:Protein of unknown function DUF262 [Draconibacterium orientale]|uniref:GmrSD restriction endonucleases N-terminal domain-containing protein n=1 Tax=Draconibacterium orientale TaxID=1168034 RepID=X5DG33_9BACT|nr:DUF262 domain-containing protein [Draconibacterium orientale]AHW60044.1 hypothetical protein FH5T_11705 [Draconibacterium orientale]SET64577.1 Protein of unknown function DUF262 [Draconibacterium orientale]